MHVVCSANETLSDIAAEKAREKKGNTITLYISRELAFNVREAKNDSQNKEGFHFLMWHGL